MGIRTLLIALAILAAAGCGTEREPIGFPPVLLPPDLPLDPLLEEKVSAQVAAIERAPASAVAHGTLGIIYEANKLWGPALSAYENAAALAPDTPEWLYHAAICQTETGDSEGAERKLAEVAGRFPAFAPGRHRWGMALLQAGDLAGAERELLAARDSARTISEASAALAELRVTEGRYAEGLELADRALALDPKYRRARYLRGLALRGVGRATEASAELAAGAEAENRRLLDRVDGEIPRYWVSRSTQVSQGADLVDAGKYDEAITILLRALAERPDDEAVINNLSVAYQRKGDFSASYDLLIGYHRKHRDHLPTLMNLAETLWSLRRHEEELAIAEHAIRVHPRSGTAHFAHAKALFALERLPDGVAAVETAIPLEPLNYELHAAAGEAWLRLQDLDRAEPRLRRAVELEPNALPPRANYCALLIRRNRLTEAEEQLRELTRRAPDHPQVRILQERFVEAQRSAPRGAPAG